MSKASLMRRGGPPPLPSRRRGAGVVPPPLPPPVVGLRPPPLPARAEARPPFARMLFVGAAMLVIAAVLIGAAATRKSSDVIASAGQTAPATRSNFSAPQVTAVDGPLEQIRAEENVDEEAPVVKDPLAPLALGVAGERPLSLADPGEVTLAPPFVEVAPASDAPQNAKGEPSSVHDALRSEAPMIVSAESGLATLAAPGCNGACPAPRDRKLGTALVWATSVEEAARQAKEAGKLVFVIHVSGNFESPEFT